MKTIFIMYLKIGPWLLNLIIVVPFQKIIIGESEKIHIFFNKSHAYFSLSVYHESRVELLGRWGNIIELPTHLNKRSVGINQDSRVIRNFGDESKGYSRGSSSVFLHGLFLSEKFTGFPTRLINETQNWILFRYYHQQTQL